MAILRETIQLNITSDVNNINVQLYKNITDPSRVIATMVAMCTSI